MQVEKAMNFSQLMQEAGSDPARLEQAYQEALRTNSDEGFAAALQRAYGEQPENLLFAAWHYRLAHAASNMVTRQVPWLFALLLAFANGLLLFLLSDADSLSIYVAGRQVIPYFILLWGPLTGLFVLAYLAHTGAMTWGRGALLALLLAGMSVYALSAYTLIDLPAFQEQYLTLLAMHLPLAAWAAVGFGVLGGWGTNDGRFAFLLKSLELYVLGGLFLSVLAVLTLVTAGLFLALGIDLPEVMQRLLVAGGGGLVPVLAIAIAYDPSSRPAEQSFESGLSRLLSLLLRLFLPLTLAVLLVYLCFVPFYFWRPFEDRDVLIIYNAMLFAVMALLLGVTPFSLRGLGPGQAQWLRRGIVAVAALTLIVSLYAFSAIVYRTVQEGLTPNRVTFIGWNLINTGLLTLLLWGQVRQGPERWLQGVHQAFGVGALLYTGWSLLVIFGLPWLF
jgi:hypothetical protein